jgi:hypothetical protein
VREAAGLAPGNGMLTALLVVTQLKSAETLIVRQPDDEIEVLGMKPPAF